MSAIAAVICCEFRIAFSKHAQPVWFRVTKWIIFLALGALFWRRPLFWWCVLAAAWLGLILHLFYRWKTRAWTQPWGGWDDLDAGRD